MFTESQLYLAMVFLKMFLRDIQSIFFNLFFPMAFIGVFLFTGGEPDPIKGALSTKLKINYPGASALYWIKIQPLK